MANQLLLVNPTNKIFRTLFDEHRILWDILRSHSYFVTRKAVKQFIPPQSFLARNYISNNETCKIRMSRLQVLPWLTLFVTPDNAVLYSENDAIVPTENNKWIIRNIDNSRLDIVDNYDTFQQGFQTSESAESANANAAISFIPSRNISIPTDNRTLNFNPNAPNDIQIDSTTLIHSGTLCNPQLDLEIGLSTHEDFRQGNVDSDVNRFNRLDYNTADHETTKQLLLSSLQMNDTGYNPNYGRLDDSWSKYLASMDIDEENNEEEQSEETNKEPAAKRFRDIAEAEINAIPQEDQPAGTFSAFS